MPFAVGCGNNFGRGANFGNILVIWGTNLGWATVLGIWCRNCYLLHPSPNYLFDFYFWLNKTDTTQIYQISCFFKENKNMYAASPCLDPHQILGYCFGPTSVPDFGPRVQDFRAYRHCLLTWIQVHQVDSWSSPRSEMMRLISKSFAVFFEEFTLLL